jgi:hypothetical protein
MTTTSREQILEMVSRGKISAAEGDELLRALEAPRRSRWRTLLDPFDQLNVLLALAIGLAAALGGVLLSRWGIRFDGALDVHIGRAAVSLRKAIVDQLVAWPLTAVVLWVGALPLARQTRLADLIANVGVARVPLLWVAAVTVALGGHIPTNPGAALSSPGPLVLLTVLTIPALVWMVALLYNGFSAASGLARRRGGLVFAGALIAAEVVSKLALAWAS